MLVLMTCRNARSERRWMPAIRAPTSREASPSPRCSGPRAHGADLGPTVQTKALAGHCDEHAVATDPEVVTQLDGSRQKRSRLGRGDKLEHLGHIGGAERDRLRAIDPGDPLLDHLHQIERPHRAPALRQLGVAVAAGDEASRLDQAGGVAPVLR